MITSRIQSTIVACHEPRVKPVLVVCRSHMRSSSWSQVESSALIGHGGTTRGAVDDEEGSRSIEGAGCSEEAAHHASASGERVGCQSAVGAGGAAPHASAR